MIDLTPAAIGPLYTAGEPQSACGKTGNERQYGDLRWAGDDSIVAAVSRVQPVSYGEIVATVGSKSVGPGTRMNIDEFTRTTAAGVEQVGGAKKAKPSLLLTGRATADYARYHSLSYRNGTGSASDHTVGIGHGGSSAAVCAWL